MPEGRQALARAAGGPGNFLRERERSSTLVGQLGSFLPVPDNVLAIAQNLDLLYCLDAALFRVGEARDELLW